jgi:hypothetical protein
MMRRLNHDQRQLFYSFSLDEVGSRGDKKALFRDSHHIRRRKDVYLTFDKLLFHELFGLVWGSMNYVDLCGATLRRSVMTSNGDKSIGGVSRATVQNGMVPAFGLDERVKRVFDVVAATMGLRGGPDFRDSLAAWLRWILGWITPPVSHAPCR